MQVRFFVSFLSLFFITCEVLATDAISSCGGSFTGSKEIAFSLAGKKLSCLYNGISFKAQIETMIGRCEAAIPTVRLSTLNEKGQTEITQAEIEPLTQTEQTFKKYKLIAKKNIYNCHDESRSMASIEDDFGATPEEIYKRICQAKDVNESVTLFHKFLEDPKKEIQENEKYQDSIYGDLGTYLTCGVIVSIKDDLLKNGCKKSNQKFINKEKLKSVVQICEDIIQTLKGKQ